jgi:putative flippase GtrA
MGIVVQMTVLCGLTSYTHLNYLLATGLAVEAAVVHNFFWHEHWTWADRTGGRTSFWSRFLGFHFANGALSLVGNLVLMRLFVGKLGISYIFANALAIALCSILNFFAGDRLVFRRGCKSRLPWRRDSRPPGTIFRKPRQEDCELEVNHPAQPARGAQRLWRAAPQIASEREVKT